MLDAKLNTLLTVAEEKSFTKAAERLSLTQPAVSNHINQLEKEFNARIFVRSNAEIKLTPEGEIALKYARRLKAINEKMYQEIRDFEKNITHLRIGITHTAESNTITETIARYCEMHSGYSVTILTDTIKNLYDLLSNYDIDIAIVEGHRTSSRFNYMMLDTDSLVCIVSPDNPLSRKSIVKLSDLKKQNMILRLSSSATRQLFEATLTSINETIENFNVSIEVDSISTIKNLVKKGMGISILPLSACLSDIKKGALVALQIENLSMTREINLVYNKDYTNEEILKDITSLYQKENHR